MSVCSHRGDIQSKICTQTWNKKTFIIQNNLTGRNITGYYNDEVNSDSLVFLSSLNILCWLIRIVRYTVTEKSQSIAWLLVKLKNTSLKPTVGWQVGNILWGNIYWGSVKHNNNYYIAKVHNSFINCLLLWKDKRHKSFLGWGQLFKGRFILTRERTSFNNCYFERWKWTSRMSPNDEGMLLLLFSKTV